MRTDGNGGINLSISIMLVLCTVISIVSSAVVYGVTTRNNLTYLEDKVNEDHDKIEDMYVKGNTLRTDFEKLCVKIDGMTDDVKEIKDDIKEIKTGIS